MTGLIVGKFMPPHEGHLYLIEQARRQVDRLTVILLSMPGEPIPPQRRLDWLRQLVGPDVEVLHADSYPTDYADPAVWDKWVATIRSVYPNGPDRVFSSEDYGRQLADLLGASHVMVDRAREAVPIAATQIRTQPMRHWGYIPPPVREWFVRRIAVLGPRTPGREALARRLADELDTVVVADAVRRYLAGRGQPLTWHDLLPAAHLQRSAEDAAVPQANRAIVVEGGPMELALWARYHFDRADRQLERLGDLGRHDLLVLDARSAAGDGDPPPAWLLGRLTEAIAAAAVPSVRLEPEMEIDSALAAARAAVTDAPSR